MEEETRMSIYRAARGIKRRDNSIYNALRSIYDDSIFVGEISQLWPDLPLVANLRCGLWYSRRFDASCYFKSTDGHTNNWSFNTSRLNLHLALLAGQKGGCIIVDSTRRGKRFPDSMSKTIPIWTCVLNRCIFNHFMYKDDALSEGEATDDDQHRNGRRRVADNWDCSLHLPLWVSETEKASIEDRLEDWTKQLVDSGADIASLASCLTKPLRPLWISQKTVIWLNEVPEHDSWDFTPVILVSASSQSGIQNRTNSEFSWHYIPGAGDDEESWARGLSPTLFWSHVYDLINLGPDLCNQKVAEIVEKDRVYRAQRGQNAPQITLKPSRLSAGSNDFTLSNDVVSSDISSLEVNPTASVDLISWLSSTNLAVGSSQLAAGANVDCILNCDQNPIFVCLPDPTSYLHLPMKGSKFDRFSILSNLPSAVTFAKLKLSKGKKLLVCCHNGEDIGVCVCLAILISLFDDEGVYDGGESFRQKCITKSDMRRRLVFICKFAVQARPSRGNLKQVFAFLSGSEGKEDS